MHELIARFRQLTDPQFLGTLGPYIYAVLAAIIFSETGLLVGFFLPGDSLLLAAGVVAGSGAFNVDIVKLNALLIVMAVVGDAVGYQVGKRAGPALFKRPKSLLFRPEHLKSTAEFYEKHGGKTIIIARFMPFVRTFAPVVAGIAQMPYQRFAMFNIVGAIGWIVSMTSLGFFLSTRLAKDDIKKVEVLVIIVSVLPVFIEVLRHRMRANKEAEQAPAVQKS